MPNKMVPRGLEQLTDNLSNKGDYIEARFSPDPRRDVKSLKAKRGEEKVSRTVYTKSDGSKRYVDTRSYPGED